MFYYLKEHKSNGSRTSALEWMPEHRYMDNRLTQEGEFLGGQGSNREWTPMNAN